MPNNKSSGIQVRCVGARDITQMPKLSLY